MTASLLEQLADLPKAEVDALIRAMAPGEANAFEYDWRYRARPEQLPPAGSWRIWPRLRESLLPLAERYGRALSSALASLETLRLAPSQAVERGRRIKDGPVTGDGRNGAVPAGEGERPVSDRSGDLRWSIQR